MAAAAPPAWVRKRDGRLEPFDADKISRALFAASESLGRPDAFLCRELTDGVIHFLGEEAEGATPTTIQIAELVTKVVRELGQPALAAAYAEHGARRDRRKPPPALVTADPSPAAGRPADQEVILRFRAGAPLGAVLAECVRSYTLQTVFARDIVAARGDGLLTLAGLETPSDLAGCVAGPAAADGILAAVEQARRFAGGIVVIDGPDYYLAGAGRGGADAAREFARELSLGLRLTGLRAVVNLNGAAPPPWAGDLAEGPLFAEQRPTTPPERLAQVADGLARELLHPGAAPGRVNIYWRMSEGDFRPEAGDRLTRTARAALDGSPLVFVFDRPRRPASLAPGVDRLHPAALLTVGVHLSRLAEQPGLDDDPARFLKKLGSLARLALSAAVQKREFLRRRERASGAPPVTGGFLLDRARLVVAPVGLDAVVQRFTGGGLCSGGPAAEFGKQIVQTLRDVLRRDGGLSRLPTCLDGPDDFHLDGDDSAGAWVAGLTPWDPTATVKNQLRSAGALHAAAERGTAALFVPEPAPEAETAAEWLRWAWKQTDVTRVRFLRGAARSTPVTPGRAPSTSTA